MSTYKSSFVYFYIILKHRKVRVSFAAFSRVTAGSLKRSEEKKTSLNDEIHFESQQYFLSFLNVEKVHTITFARWYNLRHIFSYETTHSDTSLYLSLNIAWIISLVLFHQITEIIVSMTRNIHFHEIMEIECLNSKF